MHLWLRRGRGLRLTAGEEVVVVVVGPGVGAVVVVEEPGAQAPVQEEEVVEQEVGEEVEEGEGLLWSGMEGEGLSLSCPTDMDMLSRSAIMLVN